MSRIDFNATQHNICTLRENLWVNNGTFELKNMIRRDKMK